MLTYNHILLKFYFHLKNFFALHFSMYRLKKIIIIFSLLFTASNARPWEIQKNDEQYRGTFVPHLIQALDSWIAEMLSQTPVPLVGAGAALAYIGYAGSVLLTSETKPPGKSSRSLNETSGGDILSDLATNIMAEALGRSESAVAFRRTGARALQNGASLLRYALGTFTKAIGDLYSTLAHSQRALGTNCVAERLCRIGQMTGMNYPILGVLLRSLDSADLDEYSRALIDGTTIGDCTAMYPNCRR